MKKCKKSNDKKGEKRAKWKMINIMLDMSKSLTDIPLAVHYGMPETNLDAHASLIPAYHAR